jgi:hypothetical protein
LTCEFYIIRVERFITLSYKYGEFGYIIINIFTGNFFRYDKSADGGYTVSMSIRDGFKGIIKYN